MDISADNKINKIVIIPDSFKGSMTSVEVAEILSEEAGRRYPAAEIISIPVADGGEGSMDCIMKILGGDVREAEVLSPERIKIKALYAVCGDLAVIEMAQSSGLTRQTGFDAMQATSYGFGQLIRAALDDGKREFLLCLGGSATTDCGCGMAEALGVRFLGERGDELSMDGSRLSEVCSVDVSRIDSRIAESRFTVLNDVENPLFGEKGAAYVYGPQKGASPDEVKKLDAGLMHIGGLIEKATGIPFENMKGAGAAGGCGYGCAAFLHAEMVSGIEEILRLSRFDEVAEGADLILTGEGRLDEQSLMGKVLSGVKAHSRTADIISFCGTCLLSEERQREAGVYAVEIGKGRDLSDSIENGKIYLRQAAESFFSDDTIPRRISVWD